MGEGRYQERIDKRQAKIDAARASGNTKYVAMWERAQRKARRYLKKRNRMREKTKKRRAAPGYKGSKTGTESQSIRDARILAEKVRAEEAKGIFTRDISNDIIMFLKL